MAHYFLGVAQVHVQKQTKIKMNEIDSQMLGGRRPHSFQVEGQVPPPPGSRAPG